MPEAVGRIMGREACRRQVLVHQPIDHRAEQVRPTALWTGKHIHPGRVATLPALEGLGDIGRHIDEAIDLAFPVIDAYRPGLQVDRGPGEGTRLRHAQTTAQHQEEEEAIPEGVNNLEEGHEVGVGDGFGQPLGDHQVMLPTANGLLGHEPVVAKMSEYLGEDTQLRIQRRGGQARPLSCRDKRRNVLGGRLGEIRRDHGSAVRRQGAEEPGQRLGNGAQGGRGIALGDQLGKIWEESLLIQRAEDRERGVILLGARTIHGTLSCRRGHEAHSLEESEDCRHN
jgi:hypothetical protein